MIQSVKRPVAGCLACVAGLILVTWLAYRVGTVERLDTRVLNRLAADRESSLDSAARLVAHLGDPVSQLALLAVVCLIALSRERPRRAVAAVVLVAGANLTTQILKVVLAPILGYRQIGLAAFPSGHATAVMAMAFAFVLVVPRSWRGVIALLGVCLVAAVSGSVVILHHHYPSDVIGGWLVAGGWCFAVVAGLRGAELLRPE